MNMADLRGAEWRDNDDLKEALEKYVLQGLQRREILDFCERDFPNYTWSLRTLDRRLCAFEIYYNSESVKDEDVMEAVQHELEGPGQMLGYRAMHKKIRQNYALNASRLQVYTAMQDLDPDGLGERRVGAKKRRKKGNFTSRGTNFVHSLDGHDKLMGYQNSTFPLAIYGCLDTASRKLLWLKVWVSNSNPKLIGRWYVDYLNKTRRISAMMRVDRGSETGVMTTIHAFLRRHHGDMDPHETVIYGPSTANQIERWWKELHERMEKYFKSQLSWLKDQGHYDPHNDIHRLMLAFIMIPVIQKELDIFQETVWNSHRIRAQKDTVLPNGVPNHIYSFPEKYGLDECGFPITEEQLEEAATEAGVLDVDDDFLTAEMRNKFTYLVPDEVQPDECKAAFLYLKENYEVESQS